MGKMIDKIVNDDFKMSAKAVKWIAGILISATLSLVGFAWGLYVKLDEKVDAGNEQLDTKIEKSKNEVLHKLEDLEADEVKENTVKNYKQDSDIGILYERTNSRSNSINHNSVRPVDTVYAGPPR